MSNRITPLILAVALFMEMMDSTVISTSLPAIAADIGTDPISLKLALAAYLVALAIFIPISGWMADRYGARNVFRGAIVVFMLGSIACAFADSLLSFVVARFVQGMGGSMMTPLSRLILVRNTAKKRPNQRLGLVDNSRSFWPACWTTNWWLLDHLLFLALDFLHQHPNRDYRYCARQQISRRHRYTKEAPARLGWLRFNELLLCGIDFWAFSDWLARLAARIWRLRRISWIHLWRVLCFTRKARGRPFA